MIRPLSQHLQVGLDEAACSACSGIGERWPGATPQRLGGPCPTCHGAGVPSDDRIAPELRSRLLRLLQHHPDWRALLAEALPEARVAGPWESPDGWTENRRCTVPGHRMLVEVDRVDGAWLACTYRVPVGERAKSFPTEPEARAWCDDQLRAAGWVLAGEAPRPFADLAAEAERDLPHGWLAGDPGPR